MLKKIGFLRLQSVVKILEMFGQSFFLSVMQFLGAFHQWCILYTKVQNLDG